MYPSNQGEVIQMTREILFCGKRMDNGEWVEGSLFITRKGNYHITSYDAHFGSVKTFDVDPETVGQYTGFKDKNDQRIFEGDIIDMCDNWWDACGPAGHESSKTVVRWSDYHCGFDPFANYDCDCGVYIEASECKIIGNIHDNPELIGGTEND